jgi:hypothetical protein
MGGLKDIFFLYRLMMGFTNLFSPYKSPIKSIQIKWNLTDC